MSKAARIKWLAKPTADDYRAAYSYLSLLYEEGRVATNCSRLKKARIVWYKAEDVIRASGLSLLGLSDDHVKKERKRVRSGERLAPVLLVKDPRNARLVVADGYHRLCAVHACDENIIVPCKIA